MSSSSSASVPTKNHQNDEEYHKSKNRERTSRKDTDGPRWTTVGSSDSEDEPDRGRHHRKRSRSSSPSSRSDSSDGRKHSRGGNHKREKKHHHHHDKKHRRDKHDKHHRHKSSRHGKDRERDREKRGPSLAVNQNEYGKYGIIREDSYYAKQKEFEVYMEEVKKIPGVDCLPRRDVMEYFKSYIEDYNTATMPHEKYYFYAKWESEKYQQEQARKAGGGRNPDFVYASDDEAGGGHGARGMTDEEALWRDQRASREKQQQIEFQQLKARMANSTGAREDMRRQEQLRGELQLAYRSGDTAAIAKLERVLKPDDKTAAVKHAEKLLGNKGGWK
jgi:hypothetical protein